MAREEVDPGRPAGGLFAVLEGDYIFNSGFSVYLGYKYRNIQFRYDDDLDYSVTEYYLGCRYTF